MTVEIINIGDELLIGQVTNTNAAWMSDALSLAGFFVERITVVPDEENAIISVLHDASSRSEVILLTGGLGPTRDDITKKALMRFFNTTLIHDEGTLHDIREFFTKMGREVGELNVAQALIPEISVALKNRNGTAPGIWIEKESRIFVAMPGVPFEMQPMMEETVIPLLRKKMAKGTRIYKTIHLFGIPESELAAQLEEWESSLPGHIRLAYLPQPGLIRLRISVTGDDNLAMQEDLNRCVQELRDFFPHQVFGYDTDSLQEVIGKLLAEQGKTVSTAESCTGGYLSHLITSVPGSSRYYKGSVIAYSNEMKKEMLHVEEDLLTAFGAVSKEVVGAMAENFRKISGADYCIAISGIAGPDGGTPEKPVGTVWIAVASPYRVVAQKHMFGSHRGRNIHKSALFGMNMLRLELAVAGR